MFQTNNIKSGYNRYLWSVCSICGGFVALPMSRWMRNNDIGRK
ncbi:hypothetical protein HMPREF9151_01254 [Hoylesella saccharolytica F0055]|uniref:Uncharacterized protein n=1 Tax=Hoylesella saccharolytica F0055 TaxID=1127699 RepID=L1NB19_9BACT|nr:hypothetical protein HMPREF9151_01254 [Hoylesella saccharolytica F0055]